MPSSIYFQGNTINIFSIFSNVCPLQKHIDIYDRHCSQIIQKPLHYLHPSSDDVELVQPISSLSLGSSWCSLFELCPPPCPPCPNTP